jgi:hypothetical protein
MSITTSKKKPNPRAPASLSWSSLALLSALKLGALSAVALARFAGVVEAAAFVSLLVVAASVEPVDAGVVDDSAGLPWLPESASGVA